MAALTGRFLQTTMVGSAPMTWFILLVLIFLMLRMPTTTRFLAFVLFPFSRLWPLIPKYPIQHLKQTQLIIVRVLVGTGGNPYSSEGNWRLLEITFKGDFLVGYELPQLPEILIYSLDNSIVVKTVDHHGIVAEVFN
jgi:hypothetical protein